MARFFKYKSAEQLVDDAKQLGGDLAVTDDFSALFSTVKVAGFEVGNRFAIQPMEGCDGTPDGKPDELTFRRYRRFGAGGAKLIWGEAAAVVDEGRMNPRQLLITQNNASEIEQMLQGARRAHRETVGEDSDLLIGLQLTHSGRYSYRKPIIAKHDVLLDPRIRQADGTMGIDASYPILTDDELKRLEDHYLVAAQLAWKIGFQFVDIKQCHRYLLSELLSARNRPGLYGGSLENRTRFIRNVVRRIRSELPKLIVATRMNAYDGIPYTATGEENIGQPCAHEHPITSAFGVSEADYLKADLSEPVQLATWLKDWGVSLINISAGNPYANPHVVRPAEFAPVDGYNAPEHPLIGVLRHFHLTRAIQQAVGELPVVGSGYSWLQDYVMHVAAANIQRGDVSFIGMGRATLSHPDFVTTLKQTGKLRRSSICRTFSYCTNLMRSKDHPLGQYPTGCPPFDKEIYDPLWKEVQQKRDQ